MVKRMENNKFLKIVFLIFVLLFAFRIVGMDKDLPPFGVSFFQPFDEGLYSQVPLNLYNNGSIYAAGPYVVETPHMYRAQVVYNVLQYVSLCTFGDNYWGLRMPSIFLALALCFFVYKSMKMLADRFQISSKKTTLFTFCLLAYFLLDFTFLMQSRVIENTLIRAAFLAFYIWCYLLLEKREKLCAVVMAAMATFSVFFIYFSNVFLFAPLIVFGLGYLFRKDWKEFGRYFSYSFAGAAGCYLLAELYYRIVWGSSAIGNWFRGVFSFSRNLGASTKGVGGWIDNYMRFFSGNMFFYNFLLLVLFISALVFTTYYCVKKKDKAITFILSLGWIYVIQGIVTNDYMERKSSVLLPVVLLLICIFLWKTGDILKMLRQTSTVKVIGMVGVCMGMFVLSVIGMFVVRQVYEYFADFSFNEILLVLGSGILQVLILAAALFCLLLSNKKLALRIGSVAVALVLAVNMYFSCIYVVFNENYSEKNVMESMGKEVGTSYVLGAYSISLSLYNDFHPVRHDDAYYVEKIKDPNTLYLQYGTTSKCAMKADYNFSKVFVSDRAFRTMGIYKNIALFRYEEVEEQE